MNDKEIKATREKMEDLAAEIDDLQNEYEELERSLDRHVGMWGLEVSPTGKHKCGVECRVNGKIPTP